MPTGSHGGGVLVVARVLPLPAARRVKVRHAGCWGVAWWPKELPAVHRAVVDGSCGPGLRRPTGCPYCELVRIARCVFVNKNHRRYAPHLGKGRTVPVPPVASPFPRAQFPPAHYCVVPAFVSC